MEKILHQELAGIIAKDIISNYSGSHMLSEFLDAVDSSSNGQEDASSIVIQAIEGRSNSVKKKPLRSNAMPQQNLLQQISEQWEEENDMMTSGGTADTLGSNAL